MNKFVLSILVIGFLGFAACNDPVNDSCYDAALAESMKDTICPATCEGICACNQRTYCNECEAMKAGYSVAVGDSLPCSQL